MRLFSKKARSAGENEAFVRLIQVAGEDPGIRTLILRILSLDAFNRKFALNTLIDDMRLNGAPGEFISAIACFLDDGVAEKALAILSKDSEKDDVKRY